MKVISFLIGIVTLMWDTIRRSEVVRFCMYMVCTCYVHAEFGHKNTLKFVTAACKKNLITLIALVFRGTSFEHFERYLVNALAQLIGNYL